MDAAKDLVELLGFISKGPKYLYREYGPKPYDSFLV